MTVAVVDLEELERRMEALMRRVLRDASPAVMTVEQAAAYAGRAPKTVRAWVADGLPVVRKGRRIHVKRDEIDRWLSRDEATPDAIVASLRSAG